MWCAHLYKEVVIKVEILQDWYLEDDGGTKKPGTLCVPGLSFLLSYTFPQIDPRQNILYRLVGYRLHLVPHTLCHQGSHNIFVLRYQIRLFSFRRKGSHHGRGPILRIVGYLQKNIHRIHHHHHVSLLPESLLYLYN